MIMSRRVLTTGNFEEMPKIVCLCGSTRFREEYRATNARLTNDGYIVLSCGIFQGDAEWGKVTGDFLDELHKRKIDLADEVFVINVGGYVGESTKNEIEYARIHGKPIRYLEAIV
jgi:hypothetical protein